MKYKFYTVDVFTDKLFHGNPLAVFPHASDLNDEQMQLIAKEFNLSETVFVKQPIYPSNDFLLRIFTPQRELPFAGHPTVGAACLLASIGNIDMAQDRAAIVFEEKVGEVPVDVISNHEKSIQATFSSPKMVEYLQGAPQPSDIAKSLSLEASNLLLGDLHPQIASCGTPFLMVALDSIDTLQKIKIDSGAWSKFIAECPAPAVYVYSFASASPDSHIHARMFAPTLGILEDPATGGAATALAGLLADLVGGESAGLKRLIVQGQEMGRPSRIHIEVLRDNGVTREIRVGGQAVRVSEGEFDLG